MRNSRIKAKRQAPLRVNAILDMAIRTARTDVKLARRQGEISRRISLRYNVRLPYEKKQLFCRGCKKMVIPGRTARVRMGNGIVKAIRITCLECGHTYRKIVCS